MLIRFGDRVEGDFGTFVISRPIYGNSYWWRCSIWNGATENNQSHSIKKIFCLGKCSGRVQAKGLAKSSGKVLGKGLGWGMGKGSSKVQAGFVQGKGSRKGSGKGLR